MVKRGARRAEGTGTTVPSRTEMLRGAVAELLAGKAADLVVIPLEGLAANARWDLIFESDQPPSAVYVSGVQA